MMSSDHPGPIGRDDAHSGTVLLVDGDEQALARSVLALRGSDWRVLTARESGAALEVLEREAVDVVVTELQLLELSGLELLDRARLRRPEAIRIVLTGHPSARSAIAAINREEVFRYLIKPVSRGRLLAALRGAFAALAERRARRTAALPLPLSLREVLTAEERAALREACADFGDAAQRRRGRRTRSSSHASSRW